MLLRCASCYAVVAVMFLMYNLLQFLKTKLYGRIYLKNFTDRNYAKNAVILKPVKKLFIKSGVKLNMPRGVNTIMTSWYSKEFAVCFKQTETHYVVQMIRSLVWFTFVLEVPNFRHLEKTWQLFIGVIAFLLQFAVSYLLELFLDTAGIRDSIAASLLGFLKSAF